MTRQPVVPYIKRELPSEWARYLLDSDPDGLDSVQQLAIEQWFAAAGVGSCVHVELTGQDNNPLRVFVFQPKVTKDQS